MKKVFYILVAATLFVACNNAQKEKTSYTIKGTVSEDFPGDTVLLMHATGDPIATTVVTDGKFEFSGNVNEPTNAAISPIDGVGCPFILENADYTANMTAERATVQGGGIIHKLVGSFESSDEYYNTTMAYMKADDSIFGKLGRTEETITPEEKTLMRTLEKAVLTAEDKAMFKVIDDPKAPLLAKAFALNRSQNWERLPIEKRISTLKAYEKDLGGNQPIIARMYKSYEEEIESEKAKATAKESIVEGADLKDFEVVDANGSKIKLSEIVAKNKFTILEFWASWCQPCRQEIPNLKKAYEKYKSKGLEIFAVSLDEKPDAWRKAMDEEKTPWLNYHDPSHFNGEAAKLYAIDAIPASLLISQDGKIVTAEEGALRGENLNETLATFLK